MGGGPSFDLIRGAVEDNLRAAGFRPVPVRDAAELIAVTDLRRAVRPRPAGESGEPRELWFRRGRRIGTRGVGGGVGLSFPIGKHREINRDLAVDTLSLQLRRKSDATNEWEGRAVERSARAGERRSGRPRLLPGARAAVRLPGRDRRDHPLPAAAPVSVHVSSAFDSGNIVVRAARAPPGIWRSRAIMRPSSCNGFTSG